MVEGKLQREGEVIHVIVRDTSVSMMAHMNAKIVIITITATTEDLATE